MASFAFYRPGSSEYAADFQTLLRCSDEWTGTDRLLERVLACYGRQAVAVDWGAGSGTGTQRLLHRFDTVYAVEPSPIFREILAHNCPQARLIAGTITDAVVPEAIDVATIRHVYYHIPDHKWGAYTIQAADQLTAGGVLIVTLKHPDSACNRMLEHFGAPRFDLWTHLSPALRQHPEFRAEWVAIPATLSTHSFAETLAIARFMLNDRPPDCYQRRFTQEQFEEYVRRHFWNEAAGVGGWRHDAVACLLRRNELWA